jgi:ABC-type phosphate transport system ATPase subunit
LAIALALRPEVLLLDELTSACDEATAKLIEQDLVDVTILIVTHSKVQAQRLCTDRIVIHPPN